MVDPIPYNTITPLLIPGFSLGEIGLSYTNALLSLIDIFRETFVRDQITASSVALDKQAAQRLNARTSQPHAAIPVWVHFRFPRCATYFDHISMSSDAGGDSLPLANENNQCLISISVEPMMNQLEVRGPEDDWTGITSTAERRRIQNRLHQRAYRRRQRKTDRVDSTARLSEHVYGTGVAPDLHNPGPCPDPALRNSEGSNSLVQFPEVRPRQRQGTLCNLNPAVAEIIINHYEIWARQCSMHGSPDADNLLTLVQFNVFRALVRNNCALGFNMEWLKCDATSPFNAMNQEYLDISRPPSALRPSALQRTVPHHPWLDLFPYPVMRDNILLAGEDFDDTELCIDLVEFCNVASHGERTGLVVWGEPSDPYSWEVSEGFVKKWGWVIRGCWELFMSTNYWREKRGEKKLFW